MTPGPRTIATAALVLVSVAVLVIWIPARRASDVYPVEGVAIGVRDR